MSSVNEKIAPGVLPVISVSGDPRAMGRAQGAACRAGVRAAVSGAGLVRRGRLPFSLNPFVSGSVLADGMGREIVRHYPHLSERFQGIARGAGLSIDSVMDLFVRSAQGRVESAATDPTPGAARAGEASLLCRPIATAAGAPAAAGASWIVRRSRPEVGFASVELTLPWLASAVAGVNDKGVAAMLAPAAAGGGAKAPSALLLVQECLQRFHDLPGCIDWLSKRPFSGRAAILLADATGTVATVALEDGERSVDEAHEGVLVAGGCEDRHGALSKALVSEGPVEEVASEFGARVIVSPGERSLIVRPQTAGPPEIFSTAG